MTSSWSLASDSISQFLGHQKIIQHYSKLPHAQDKAKRRKIIYNNTDNTINTNNQMGATTAHLRRGDEAREPGSSTTTSGSSAIFRLIQSKVMRMMIKKMMMMNLQQTHDREITAELFKGCKLFTPSRESQYRSPYIPNSKFRSLYAMNTY